MNDPAKRVLLIEDNPDDAALTLRAFARNHMLNPFIVMRDGIEALDYLFARSQYANLAATPLPTLVLLDLKLPRLDGLNVLKAIRRDERTRLLPVVVMTSSREEQDLINSYALGANSYIRKPVDFAEFMEASKILGLYWLMLNQSPLLSRDK